MKLKRDSFGTTWYAEGPGGVRVPVDPEREFGHDWPGHYRHDDEEVA